MNRRTRLIFLGLSLILLIAIGWFVKGDFSFLLNDFWFTSGFLLLILLSLIDQPHFSKDSNVFINAVTAGISLLLVEQGDRSWIFWCFFGTAFYLAISSYILMWVRSKPLINEQKSVQFFSRINRQIGKPETLFSAFFLWGALRQFGLNSNEFNYLLLYWVVFMIVNLSSIASILNSLFEKADTEKMDYALGRIFGVQSKNTFLVKLFPERKETIKLFDFVEFRYSIDSAATIRKGLVLDSYLLNQEQWIKVLISSEINDIFEGKDVYSKHSDDVVYKIKDVPENKYIESFIGIITEKSHIGKIRFIYNSKAEIQEGQLLEVKVGEKKNTVYYQVVDGETKIETLENKNETGLILGEAVQLGTWNNEKVRFEQYGWVPSINSPVYIASAVQAKEITENEFKIGEIPGTNFPVIINKEIALTHHTAVLGVTGTGKSVFSRNLIREYLKEPDLKVICIDFTGEYVNKLRDLNPVKTISDDKSEEIFKLLDNVVREEDKGYKKEQSTVDGYKKDAAKLFNESITEFLQSEDNISIFELPDVSNSWSILEYTRLFFRLLFHIAKKEQSFGKRVCIVLEEAHTVIPETATLGVSDYSSKAAVNSIAQIALQGRKYNVGLLVIAQRTANVSKTVLTQCNTIIAFQEFDKTSSEFLSNYFGEGISKTLPNLKFRQAIAAGKALKSNVPMIFEVPEIIEPETVNEEESIS